MVKMAKIEAILGAARTRTMRRTKDNLEKGRQPPEKMFIFGKSFIKKLRPFTCVVRTSLLSINVNKLNFSDQRNLVIA